MALTNTTLAAACGRDDTTIRVTSASGFSDKNLIRIDNEFMAQAGSPSTSAPTVIPVRRGLEGSAQLAHGLLADVVTGTAAEFPPPAPGQIVSLPPGDQRFTIGADVTIATADLPAGPATYVITKAT